MGGLFIESYLIASLYYLNNIKIVYGKPYLLMGKYRLVQFHRLTGHYDAGRIFIALSGDKKRL